MINKNYWQEIPHIKQHPLFYKLRCPRCGKIFDMPKKWGVWKGCPICWAKLDYKGKDYK